MLRDSGPRPCRRQCMAMAFLISARSPVGPPCLRVVIRSFHLHTPIANNTTLSTLPCLLLGHNCTRKIHCLEKGTCLRYPCLILWLLPPLHDTCIYLAPPDICYRLASVVTVCKQCLNQVRHLVCLKFKPQLALYPQILDIRQ